MKSLISKRVEDLIRARKIARMLKEREQRQLIQEEDIFHQQLVEKLDGMWETNQYENLVRCGHEKLFRTCKCCGRVEEFLYRCDLKFCPRCQWRISKRREEKIRVWSSQIKQPKHLVLTQKNFPILTGKVLRSHQKNLARLRRHQCFKNVQGGCVSVEITNEGNGWHLHSHWLLEVRWLDMAEVSRAWGALVGQSFAVVKCKDVRGGEYVHELCKYLAKGSEICAWPREKILEFVCALRGRRFFFCFGRLFRAGEKIRRQLAFMKKKQPPCECGERNFRFETEREAVFNEAKRAASLKPKSRKRAEEKKYVKPSPAPTLF